MDGSTADVRAAAARDASKRLERTRRAALELALAEKRHRLAEQMTSSLVESLGDDARRDPGQPQGRP